MKFFLAIKITNTK